MLFSYPCMHDMAACEVSAFIALCLVVSLCARMCRHVSPCRHVFLLVGMCLYVSAVLACVCMCVCVCVCSQRQSKGGELSGDALMLTFKWVHVFKSSQACACKERPIGHACAVHPCKTAVLLLTDIADNMSAFYAASCMQRTLLNSMLPLAGPSVLPSQSHVPVALSAWAHSSAARLLRST